MFVGLFFVCLFTLTHDGTDDQAMTEGEKKKKMKIKIKTEKGEKCLSLRRTIKIPEDYLFPCSFDFSLQILRQRGP